jgi:hypothetical protein
MASNGQQRSNLKQTRINMPFLLKSKAVFIVYSISQNNVPFPSPDNFVKIGKNSQIKARKSEQGQSVKITR